MSRDWPDSTNLDEVGLNVRAYNCLKGLGLKTFGDVRAKPDNDFLREPNFGRVSLKEIRDVIGPYNRTAYKSDLTSASIDDEMISMLAEMQRLVNQTLELAAKIRAHSIKNTQ